MKARIALVALPIVALLATLFVIASPESAGGGTETVETIAEVATTASAPAPTTTTIDPAAIDAFLTAWQDAENAAAAEAFAAEAARIEAEAEAARQAEAAHQAEHARRAEAARQATTTSAPQPAPVPQAPASYGSGACGGDLPPCYVMMRESGGNITAQNPVSTASGKWQFIDSTWAGYGGYAKARYAPEHVQDEKARQLWAGGAGCSHWSAC